ncbi:MAG: DUF2240 family protein [Candidatus Lokiarchaeota archaeon]|nr:DUF2240 family protein [Candidatus Lokiarchaeota archaeon]
MTLYIWKIIELPWISISDLIYKLSFELFLFSPKEAKEFIKKAVHNGFLIIDNDNKLSLSNALTLDLKNWHRKRSVEILKKVNKSTSIAQNFDNYKKNSSNKFNILLKAFLDTGTINRAVLVSDSAITISTFDPHNKIIKAEVKGSQKTPYIIEISTKEKLLKHDCNDFQTKRAQNKKFCKHLAKLFLLLKEKDEKGATLFLENITNDINKWEFVI